MKRCANGHITHNDNLSFCTECGKLLEPCTPAGGDAPQKPRQQQPQAPQPPQKPRRGAWSVIKRVLIVLVALIVVLVVWISSKINSTTYLTFNTEGVVFPKGGSSAVVNIDYDGIIWELTYTPSWLTVIEDDDDDSMLLIADGNESGSTRSDHITVKSGKIVCQLPVEQLGRATHLSVSPRKIDTDRSGGTYFVEIESDGVSSDINYPKFCDIETEDNSGFYVKLGYNEGNVRSGTITVSEDGLSSAIYVHQTGDCPDCGGHGSRSCPSCGGMGQIGFGMFSSQCFFCGGTGTVRCASCGGRGER